ncbi:MAG: hypothetical protein CWE10_08970 [Symbiobacterium thermophilum]|uniref:Uncharacterized protein n=1 Tax=Symbiobacterium thermophilum TaxID=2734 RepID=A0A953IDJ4_SYMTR|nr:hypothetical protein [Symbiobacterium thermophilum]
MTESQEYVPEPRDLLLYFVEFFATARLNRITYSGRLKYTSLVLRYLFGSCSRVSKEPHNISGLETTGEIGQGCQDPSSRESFSGRLAAKFVAPNRIKGFLKGFLWSIFES